jgi:hypothetical protein
MFADTHCRLDQLGQQHLRETEVLGYRQTHARLRTPPHIH